MKYNWKHKLTEENDESDETRIISIEKGVDNSIPLGNRIYFYADVDKDSILTLNRQIDEISKQMKLVQFTFNLPTPPYIEIHICSNGGEVWPTMSCVDKIINSEIPIHTYCEGLVASAATLISCAGHKRIITRNSGMLIHQISSGFWGSYMELKDELQNLDLMMNIIKNIYLKKTKFMSSELDDILKHDLYLNADQCLEKGLIDIII
jgi:ATP-dependent protease ClpP protease subunit